MCSNSNERPLLVLKPKFISVVFYYNFLPLIMLVIVWGAGFFGILSILFIKGFKLNIPLWLPAVIFGCILLFVMSIILQNIVKNYAKIEYRFYKARLVFYGGLFSFKEKEISYNLIPSAYLKKNIIQKRYNLGKIALRVIPVKLILDNIENPDDAFKKIEKIISASRNTFITKEI